MILAITGANGFLGSATVQAARRSGHAVRAIVRSESAAKAASWFGADGVELAIARFDDPQALHTALSGCDAVIHVAAAKSGSFDEQFAATVTATEQLLAAMSRLSLTRLVAISSFALYDYGALPSSALLSEDSALESEPSRRDSYAQVKLLQELRVRDWGTQAGRSLTILRPGLIYGPGQIWQFFIGRALGASGWLAIGPQAAALPVTQVDNCAEAIVLAAEATLPSGTTLNLVDDDLPTRAQYLAAAVAATQPHRRVLPLPWPLLHAAASFFSQLNQLLGNKLPLPWLLRRENLDAGYKPLRYSNAGAKAALGWQPARSWRTALTNTQSNIS